MSDNVPIQRIKMKIVDYGLLEVKDIVVRTGSAAVDVFHRYLEGEGCEHLVVIGLNSKNRILAILPIAVGSVDMVISKPAHIFQPLIAKFAVKFLIGHNHPSCDPRPSTQDIQLFKKIRRCGNEDLDIEFLDGIIVTDDKEKSYSFMADERYNPLPDHLARNTSHYLSINEPEAGEA